MVVRAVIDTNVWISSLLNPLGFPAQIRKAFVEGAFTAVVSEPILEEIAHSLARPRIRRKYAVTDENILEFLILINERAEHVSLPGSVKICRDKDDDAVIETAIQGSARYIVSRDDDLRRDTDVSAFLSRYGVSVLSIADFLEAIKTLGD